MKLVNSSAEIISEKDPVKKIERVARVCYKSEDKICEGSAEKMVRALVKNKHYAMLEHSSIILQMDIYEYTTMIDLIAMLRESCGEIVELRATCIGNRNIISGNMRAWLEFFELVNNNTTIAYVDDVIADIFKDDKYDCIFGNVMKHLKVNYTSSSLEVKEIGQEELTEWEKGTHLDITVKFICDRGVSHEIVRHRKASYAQESTRYCNYGKAGEVAFINPCTMCTSKFEKDICQADLYLNAEKVYLALIADGVAPQIARDVLPMGVKTELVMTANVKEWAHFYNLRVLGTTGKPHPNMEYVARKAMESIWEKYPSLIRDAEKE